MKGTLKGVAMLSCAAIIAGFGCRSAVQREDGTTYTPPNVMHLYKPRVVGATTNPLKLKPFFPPKGVGLEDGVILRDSPPVKISGDNELAAFQGIKGKGTKEDPYIIENLRFTIDKSVGLWIEKTKKQLIIRNIECVGVPDSPYYPNKFAGIRIDNSRNVVIEHCELSKCRGIYIGGCVNVSVTDSRLFSTVLGIFSSGGSHISALRNHIEDSARYGIFLYNGPDMEIGWNYVAWTAREGIGTNGMRSQNHYYHDNLIEHCGWTAINLEGTCDKSKVINNSVRDTFYGIIIMGADVLAKSNKVYYSGQDGIMVTGAKTRNLKLINNLVVGSARNGVWLMPGTSGHDIRDNKILLSYFGIKNNASDTVITENYIERFFRAVETSESARIAQNVFKQGRNGVNITDGVKTAVVEKNEFSYLCVGMIVKGNEGTRITKNKFIYVGRQVRLYDSKDLDITNNEFLHQAYLGVDLTNCRGVRLTDNFFSDATTRSIKITGGGGNTIKDNKISDVQAQFLGGALLLKNTKNNEIADNSFKRCAIAIRFDGGGSAGNVVKDNEFEATRKKLFFAKGHSDAPLPSKEKRTLLEKNTFPRSLLSASP
ncbi:MAG: hypothetical protein GXP32_03045 [Kiritimatiellaeota bacterium]|nr:hypothetical protein [Kiritimatiellota bacterium]